MSCSFSFFFSSRRRHTRCALVTGVQTCALPISLPIPTHGICGSRRWVRRADRYPALVLRVDRGAPFIGDARRAERTGSGGKRLVIPADDQGDVGHEKTVPSTSSANASRLLNRIDDPLKFRHQIDPLAQLILLLARLAATLPFRSERRGV